MSPPPSWAGYCNQVCVICWHSYGFLVAFFVLFRYNTPTKKIGVDYMQDELFSLAESEEQRAGRNKQTTIDHTYINSGEYRRKFNIFTTPELQRLVYQLAKQMLNHRSGTLFEDMYWVDLDDCEVIASETNAAEEERIDYSKRTIQAIQQSGSILTIHTHPNSHPPSIQDFNSNYLNGYSLGLVLCHNGQIYAYTADETVDENYFSAVVANYKKSGYNECEAQLEALKEIQQHFQISFKEVTAYGNEL